MRDPKRIKRITKALTKLWEQYPDQRLGQLFSNYVFERDTDIFYQEDNLTEIMLKENTKERI